MILSNIVGFDGLGIGPFFVDESAVKNLFGTKIDIYWSVLFLLAGVVAGFFLTQFFAVKKGMKPETVFDVSAVFIVFGALFARLFYAVFNAGQFDSFFDIFNPSKKGTSLLFFVLAGAFAAWVFAKIKKMDLKLFLDTAAIGLLLGQTVGRAGDFFSGSAAGTVNTQIPWGMTVNNKGPFHPVFLYEMLLTLLGLILLIFYFTKLQKHRGETASLYFLWYGCSRAVLEIFRSDTLQFLSLNVTQVLAVLCAVAGLVCYIAARLGIGERAEKQKVQKEKQKELPYDDIYRPLLEKTPENYAADRKELEQSIKRLDPKYLKQDVLPDNNENERGS